MPLNDADEDDASDDDEKKSGVQVGLVIQVVKKSSTSLPATAAMSTVPAADMTTMASSFTGINLVVAVVAVVPTSFFSFLAFTAAAASRCGANILACRTPKPESLRRFKQQHTIPARNKCGGVEVSLLLLLVLLLATLEAKEPL